jgi:chemotaxis protein MotB
MAGKKKEELKNIIVVRKRNKKNHTAHLPHGSWKVAYADFVTAMMAFFLLMWLVNSTNEDQRKQLSDYFNPYQAESQTQNVEVDAQIISISDGGKLAGEDISERELKDSQGESYSTAKVIQEPKEKEGNLFVELATIELDREYYEELMYKSEQYEKIKDNKSQEANNIKSNSFEVEESIKEIWEKVSIALKDLPEFKKLSNNLLIEQVPEGLKIQIIDEESFSMFELGSSKLTKEARTLLKTVGNVLKNVDNMLAISGHTDGRPFLGNRNYTNWELSSDRANEARLELIKAGVPKGKFERIEGRADTDHLIEDDPLNPKNRRISILVLRYYE